MRYYELFETNKTQIYEDNHVYGVKIIFNKEARFEMFGVTMKGRIKLSKNSNNKLEIRVIRLSDENESSYPIGVNGQLNLSMGSAEELGLVANNSYRLESIKSTLWTIKSLNIDNSIRVTGPAFITKPLETNDYDDLTTMKQNFIVVNYFFHMNKAFEDKLKKLNIQKMGIGNDGQYIILDPSCSITDYNYRINYGDRSCFFNLSISDCKELGLEESARYLVREHPSLPKCYIMVKYNTITKTSQKDYFSVPAVTISPFRNYMFSRETTEKQFRVDDNTLQTAWVDFYSKARGYYPIIPIAVVTKIKQHIKSLRPQPVSKEELMLAIKKEFAKYFNKSPDEMTF